MAAEVDGIPTDHASYAKEASGMIEVERKFVISDDTEQKIIDLGGSLLKHKMFHDIYYDTTDYQLTLADYWLRQRNGQWQLKCPPAVRHDDTTATQYAEFTCELQILEKLSDILNIHSTEKDQDPAVSELISRNHCQSFASFQTDRRSYSLQEAVIDLDVTDFGFSVGEIEVIAANEDRVADAVLRINQLAHKLEVHLLGAATLPTIPTPGITDHSHTQESDPNV